ncbi:MAG: alpha-amylase family glycosyl hydrolase [Terriglobia bacterium]|nr:alpha-amylase family glycosyl hydrolase [Terriglobia bacterium]
MKPWPKHPVIYEINTWVWLAELAQRFGTFVDLGSVPQSEYDAIAAGGFDAVWFMGVWERSPAGISIANRNENLLADFRRALPDFRPEDNVGSPYCIRRYVVDQHLGGAAGLAIARRELAKRGMRLILDFVPNHVAPDHPWANEHPEYFIQGSADDLRNDPASYLQMGSLVYACGRDPYFPAWPDVLQLNAFQPELRAAVVETVSDIAAQCDGVRCDMAMLLVNSVFERTWGGRAGTKPTTEYWVEPIRAAKLKYPNFLFIAEAYWDMEWELQQLGFDFCYDKRLYDRLEHDGAENIRLHLCAEVAYQEKLLRFIENHDEPRAAAAFYPAKEKAAAVVTSTLMGARLFHEGQLEGRKVRLPVFLGRRPSESVDPDIQEFYKKLLLAIDKPVFREGEWSLCQCTGWPDNRSFQNVVAWRWSNLDERFLIVVNLSDAPAQAIVHVGWEDLAGQNWIFRDTLSDATYDRCGDELLSSGLYIELAPWNCHFCECQKRVPAQFVVETAA